MIKNIQQITVSLTMHRFTNYALVALIFAALLSYVYFANTTVRALTVLEKIKLEEQSLSVNVSEMESKRLSKENGINTEKALYLGFVQVDNPTFIIKNSHNTALSLKMN
jgi:hypothetical protein